MSETQLYYRKYARVGIRCSIFFIFFIGANIFDMSQTMTKCFTIKNVSRATIFKSQMTFVQFNARDSLILPEDICRQLISISQIASIMYANAFCLFFIFHFFLHQMPQPTRIICYANHFHIQFYVYQLQSFALDAHHLRW